MWWSDAIGSLKFATAVVVAAGVYLGENDVSADSGGGGGDGDGPRVLQDQPRARWEVRPSSARDLNRGIIVW